MKEFMTAAEIAAERLPQLPADVSAIIRKAKREGWPSQQRQGRGGGREYAVAALPEAAQRALVRRSASSALQPVSNPGLPAPIETAQLAGWQRQTMDARAALLDYAAQLADEAGGMLKAEHLVAELAAAGELPPGLQGLVPAANARKGEGRVLSAKSLRNWRSARDKGGVAALAPKAPEGKAMPEWLPTLVKLQGMPSAPSIAGIIKANKLADALPQGVAAPSLRTAQAAVAKLGAIARNRGRLGPRELKKYRAAKIRDFSMLEPLDVVSADGHRLKAEVAHPITGRAKRPEIVTIIDIATRRVIGWSSGLDESAWLVADALRVTCSHTGIPAIWYTDNGPGFVNEVMNGNEAGTVIGLLGRIGITHKTSLPYNARARGVIERLNGTLWGSAAKELPTYVGDDMDREARQIAYRATRRDLRLVGSSRLLMSWADYCDWVIEKVAAYNSRPHSTLPKIRDQETLRVRHMTPDEAWAGFVERGWEPIMPQADEIDDMFRPHMVRTIKAGRIQLGDKWYGAAALDLADMHGAEVRVGYDIRDPGQVWVRDLDDRLICTAALDWGKTAYMPQSDVEKARELRTRQALARLDRKAEGYRAELRPVIDMEIPEDTGPVPEPLRLEAPAEEISDEDRWYARACSIEQRMDRGEEISAADREWLDYAMDRSWYQARRAADLQLIGQDPQEDFSPPLRAAG